jgi:hypothetical protein
MAVAQFEAESNRPGVAHQGDRLPTKPDSLTVRMAANGRTTMSAPPCNARNRKIARRQPRVGEHLWAIRHAFTEFPGCR